MWKLLIASLGGMTFLSSVSCVGAANESVEVVEQVVKGTGESSLKHSEEYQIGVMVKAISQALKSPANPESMEVVVQYGTDSRYYVMIRGWIIQELQGAESQLQANRNVKAKSKFQIKVNFLKKAVRRIDLE